MLYFLDTEFAEAPGQLDLISIALVSGDGREFYAEAIDGWSPSRCNDWVKEHVLPNLTVGDGVLRVALTREAIRQRITHFVGHDKPEFWGYYADYDWVAFCWLFGAMIDLPKGWPMFCRDVRQLADQIGNPTLPFGNNRHNALEDARSIRDNFNWLLSQGATPGQLKRD